MPAAALAPRVRKQTKASLADADHGARIAANSVAYENVARMDVSPKHDS
jgi:hypothetical protein